MSDRLAIPYKIRDRHIFIAGKTRHGKTTVMHSMILQDIANGAGVCLIDPKGDFANALIHEIPKHRKKDAIWLDLHSAIPLDFMSYKGEDEKDALVGELKFIIEGHDANLIRADAILEDLFYSLLAIPGTNFLDIYRFFRHEGRRKWILDQLETRDPELWKRWDDDFPTPNEWKPITTRVNKFWRNPSLRKIFGQADPPFKIGELMDQRKIILVNLGGIGSSKNIYGALLIARIQQAAFRREAIPPRERVPFFLYVDEFQKFQTSSFEDLLSMAGGYGIRLTLANQYLHQIKDLLPAILGNVSTYILLRMSGKDALAFKDEIDSTPSDDYTTAVSLISQLRKLEAELNAIMSLPDTDTDRADALHQEILVKRRMVKSFSGRIPIDCLRLTKLAPYYALYQIGANAPVIKDISRPPVHRGPSYAKEIKEQTLRDYRLDADSAEVDEKRIPTPDPSDTEPPVLSLKQDETLQQSGEPKHIPSNKGKKAGPRPPR